MSIAALSSIGSVPSLDTLVGSASLERGSAPGSPVNDPDDVRRAAGKFEAILVRQFLAPALEPLMSGGLGGSGPTGNSGGGVYGHILTDVLADSLTQGGGLGLGEMLARQLTPRGVESPASPATADAATDAWPVTSSRALSQPHS